jgi:hypothetical protein
MITTETKVSMKKVQPRLETEPIYESITQTMSTWNLRSLILTKVIRCNKLKKEGYNNRKSMRKWRRNSSISLLSSLNRLRIIDYKYKG